MTDTNLFEDFEELKELDLPELSGIIQTKSESDIDFDNIKSTENRSKQFKIEKVTCPNCKNFFQIQI